MSDGLSADRLVASEDHWIPLSDLMTGLMVMFLLIAVCYMVQVEADAERIKTVAVAYNDTRDALYEALRTEFSPDLPRWHAQLLKEDLTIRFSEPEILFAEGSSELKPALLTFSLYPEAGSSAMKENSPRLACTPISYQS